MASRVRDFFNRPDGPIGNAETGQPWVNYNGAAEVRSNRAFFPTNPGLVMVNTGVGGGDVNLSCDFPAGDGSGQALYLRASSIGSCWRIFKAQQVVAYTYQSGTTPSTPAQYGYVGNGTYYYEPAGEFVHTHNTEIAPGMYGRGLTQKDYYDYDYRINAYRGLVGYNTIYQPSAPGGFRSYMEHYTYRQVYENQTYQMISPEQPGQPIYSTGYQTVTEVVLQKVSNGSATTVKRVSVNDGSLTSLSATAKGDDVAFFTSFGLFWNGVDPFNKSVHTHGIGRVDGVNNFGIESFSAEPDVLTGYLPPLML